MSAVGTPLVTVAMPVFNGKRTLPLAIASLQMQTYANWELIVIDDGSTDGTPAVIRRFADRDPRIVPVFGRRNEGLVARLNQAIDKARGSLLARMDADDVSFPQRLDQQVALVRANPEVDLVGCAMVVFRDDDTTVRKWGAPVSHEEICRRPAVGFRLYHPTWLGRAEWFRAHRYRAPAVRCEDQDLLARSYRHSVFANLAQPLVGYREPHKDARKRVRGRVNYLRLGARGLIDQEGLAVAHGVAWHALRAAIDLGADALALEDALFRLVGSNPSVAERRQWDLACAGAHDAVASASLAGGQAALAGVVG